MLTTVLVCNKLIPLVVKSVFIYLDKIKMPYENLMTIEEVADYLRVKKRTVYDWLKKGKIPAIKTVGQWRFKREKIDAWLEKGS